MKKRKSVWMVLWSFLLVLSLQIGIAPKKAGAAERINFYDKSGRYLEKQGDNWYVLNEEGKKLTGLQDVKINETIEENGRKIYKGYYYFDSKGALLKQAGPLYFKNKVVNGRTFNGYYYNNISGRLASGGNAFYYVKGIANDKTFDGIYYTKEDGAIDFTSRIRYAKGGTLNKTKYAAGFYHFNKGVLVNKKHTLRNVNTVSTGIVKTFEGTYYFGDTNGRLLTKAGWITVNGNQYYLDADGKVAMNCWIGQYYVLGDGKRAYNGPVPGGYVDCDGIKCGKTEWALSDLKKEIRSKISYIGGTWGIYVKDMKTGDVIAINENLPMYPASVMKAYVMAATYDKMSKGELANPGAAENTIAQMIKYSDNNCHNELLTMQTPSGSVKAGLDSVNSWLSRNGFKTTRDHHTLHPSYFYSQGDGTGISNVTTAYEGALLMYKIYKGTCVNSYYSSLMKDKLLNQSVRGFLSGRFPSYVPVADKPGNTMENYNDIAIVYGPKRDFIMSVFTDSVPYAISNMNDIALMVYNRLEK